jgi:DNA-binding transcriptional MerR regulator
MMKETASNIYNIDDLARESGLNRRTVRYYIHRGLLQRPCGSKRGSYYTDKHLNRLLMINKLASQGVPLVVMMKTLDCSESETSVDNIATESATWREAELFDGIRISFVPNALTRSELEQVHKFVNNLMREKGRSDKADRHTLQI